MTHVTHNTILFCKTAAPWNLNYTTTQRVFYCSSPTTTTTCHGQKTRNEQISQQDVPGRQLMEDRWPHGEKALFRPGRSGRGGDGGGSDANGNGSPTLTWHDRAASSGVMGLGQGQGQPIAPRRLGETPPADPFAVERPLILEGGGGGSAGMSAAVEGNGAIGDGEIRAKPPAVPRPRYRMIQLYCCPTHRIPAVRPTLCCSVGGKHGPLVCRNGATFLGCTGYTVEQYLMQYLEKSHTDRTRANTYCCCQSCIIPPIKTVLLPLADRHRIMPRSR